MKSGASYTEVTSSTFGLLKELNASTARLSLSRSLNTKCRDSRRSTAARLSPAYVFLADCPTLSVTGFVSLFASKPTKIVNGRGELLG